MKYQDKETYPGTVFKSEKLKIHKQERIRVSILNYGGYNDDTPLIIQKACGKRSIIYHVYAIHCCARVKKCMM